VRASDKRARFVGIAAYEAEGGAVLRDLFREWNRVGGDCRRWAPHRPLIRAGGTVDGGFEVDGLGRGDATRRHD
jgi:hypothetical protein